MHSHSLSSDHHIMSLNIAMKIIRPSNCDGSPILVMNAWILLKSCDVVNPGKIFHSNYIGFPSIVSKVLCCGESLNQLDFSSQTEFNVGFWIIFPRHNTESENTYTFACEWLMTSSSLTKDQCFHEESSQLIWDTPKISSDCPTIHFSDMSNICFIVRLFPVFWWSVNFLLKTWTFTSLKNACRCLALHLLKNGPISFASDHSPCARMTVTLTKSLILWRGVRVHMIVNNDKLVSVPGERTRWLFTYRSPRSCFQHFIRFPLLRRPLDVNVLFWGVWWASAQCGSLRACLLHF